MTVKKPWLLIAMFCSMFICSACGEQITQEATPSSWLANRVQISQKPGQQTRPLTFAKQPKMAKEQAKPVSTNETGSGSASANVTQGEAGAISAGQIPTTGPGVSPYGMAPGLSTEEIQLTQKLFILINTDRAARGLAAYSWNETLAGGARLHSWNMYHCGFSHTCPDGRPQCTRIASEGFAGVSDCGENIAYAGPFPTAWEGVYKIQESMVNEPANGWHRIHLFSTTLHRIGVGVFVDPQGYIWFTEDMVS